MLLSACKTDNAVVDGVKSAGSAVADGVGNVTTSLVKVDLSNVLNDLALDLNVDKSNIPINAQIPISLAANVCGISINILSIGGGGESKGCTATTASPELVQAVQQQLAANGGVGGGAQTNGGATSTSGTVSNGGTTAPVTSNTTTSGTTTTGTTTAPPTTAAGTTQTNSTSTPQ
ncbi:hypothetical protein G7077_11165 [Sphingomonas piscis]|uniref:Uncharacterized protein n=1 Tax=Sphingomonas piscis TaxID=2714943 RepID=A0A6G7YRL3_9SPHN|nr:hypothetical protein [Sphingomonas piscis]QIK79380.1 hypothetical protein G7077_11165 [Sphingomonas piscis]